MRIVRDAVCAKASSYSSGSRVSIHQRYAHARVSVSIGATRRVLHASVNVSGVFGEDT